MVPFSVIMITMTVILMPVMVMITFVEWLKEKVGNNDDTADANDSSTVCVQILGYCEINSAGTSMPYLQSLI